MTCREVKKLVYLYRDGELPAETRRLVSQHIDSCHRCANELRNVTRTAPFLARLRSEEPSLKAPRDLTEQIMRAIEPVSGDRSGKDPTKALRSVRMLQTVCTFAAAAIVCLFFFQNIVDASRELNLESRLSTSVPVMIESPGDPLLAGLGFNAVAEFARLVTEPPAPGREGWKEQKQREETARTVLEVLQTGPPEYSEEVHRLRAKYPDLWAISPFRGITSHDREVVAQQGKALLNDLRSLLQPGRN
jgi:hypothetical protein